ncbi:carboxymuconolactone decarboxylase family protein [Pseudomonas aeruginosa]|nr:carboxymuconolactone decarboxylase family protein [Pseudomonas aeruginosa]MCS8829180.1 carboxymuconolactone decarboxylase family protein [Pseudomonas aeruginosa]MCS8873999.1 carboxymuconolactone decarboxylase family protein [Pseudomonas aeruginosa]MCS8908003.1 carboxymuconolactone decarboxylase family protein [Pseudomonas aeruginosa]MCS8914054.1 carboxymuconolactone decarboxylase family protein [Pseudomonas aeruginosa]
MRDWSTYRDSLLACVCDFATFNPEVIRGLVAIDTATARSAHLEPKIHDLIALAVAVTTRCDGCISIHSKKAIEDGATSAEITEALGVAIALNAGATFCYVARVFDALAQLPDK